MKWYSFGAVLLGSVSILVSSCISNYSPPKGIEKTIDELNLGSPSNDIGGGKCGDFYSFIWRNQTDETGKVTGHLYYQIRPEAGFVDDEKLKRLIKTDEIGRISERNSFMFLPRKTEEGYSTEIVIMNNGSRKQSSILENHTACDALWESEQMPSFNLL